MRNVLGSRSFAVGLAAVLAVCGGEGIARAEADTFGLGSGHDGPLTVTSTTGQVINTYAPVTAAVAAGATTVTVGAGVGAATTITPGQLVLLWQARGGFATPPVSGSAATVTLTSASKTGRYELARVASVAGAVVTLTHAVVNAFDAGDTQLVSVPEHTTVTINATAKLVPRAWDGATGTGGILAFLATGAVANAGVIDVSAAGFDGGRRVTSPGSPKGCAALDGVPGVGTATGGGAHKGEGLDPAAFSGSATFTPLTPRVFARGNVATAGGGGNCFNGGGGGGGNGGAGGSGGDTNPEADNGVSRAVGGAGGVAASFDPAATLVLGAGGGAGEDDDGVGGAGGGGGGVLWMRGDSLTGTGTINADGQAGTNAGTAAGDARFSDGGGGGGAGGGVFASFKGNAACGGITARGGKGGDATPTTPGRNYGPGGGGGGGRVRVASAGGTCNAVVTPGASGLTGGVPFGASAGAAGVGAAATAYLATTCDIATGKCGGCVSDAYCPPASPTCNVAAGASQYTCGGGGTTGAPYGQPPNGGIPCVGGATPTQGTSSGCQNNLCDTKDDLCGFALGTTCATSSQCRSGFCDGTSRCAVNPDGGAGDGGGGDGGGGGTNDGGLIDVPEANPVDERENGASLEGGGLSCNTAPSGTSSLLTLAGLAAVVGAFVRRRRR